MDESAKESKLIAQFNTLKEDDKDIVIKMAELFAAKHKNSMTAKVDNDIENVYNYDTK